MAVLSGILVFLLSFFLVTISTPLVRKYALRWKLGDKPNGRKIHTRTIPHLGGIGMVLGTLTSLAVVALLLPDKSDGVLPLLGKIALPVGMIVALGLTDDTKNLRPRQKLMIQIVAAVLLAASGFHLFLGLPALDSNLIFTILITSLYLVGVSSAVNLIDGHDGLAAGLCLISSSSFAILAWMLGAPTLLLVSLAMMGTCLGFLLFNFPPGKIFMGDTGSMFLGIMLGIVACAFTMHQPGVQTFVAVCFILVIPMMDAWLAIARRLTFRMPVFQADCMHVHHVVSSFGFNARQTLVVLYAMQLLMAVLGVLALKGFIFPVVIGAVVLLVLFFTFYRVMVASREREEKPAAKFAPTSVPSLEK